jgi:uncharacterized membrane protein
MKKSLILKIILGLIIGIQFIRPNKNILDQPSENDITFDKNLTLEVKEIINTSCVDCHSNNTNYPWYNQIAPFSWLIANHVNEGKDHLNFSEWSIYNKNQKKHILDEIKEVIEENKMPLKSYLLLHNEGEITNQERQYLLEWIELEKIKHN